MSVSFTITRTDGETRALTPEESAALVVALEIGAAHLHPFSVTQEDVARGVDSDFHCMRCRDAASIAAWLWPERDRIEAYERAKARRRALNDAMDQAIGSDG